MDFFIVGGAVAVLFSVILVLMRSETLVSGPDTFPFIKKSALCTAHERRFLGCLVMAVGSDYLIFSKVRLADMLKIQGGLKGSDRIRAYERVSKDTVDFVLCNKANTEVICAIQLYDREKQAGSVKQRAVYLTKVFKQIGVPFVRFPVSDKYPSHLVEENIRRAIQRQMTQAAEDSAWEYANQAS